MITGTKGIPNLSIAYGNIVITQYNIEEINKPRRHIDKLEHGIVVKVFKNTPELTRNVGTCLEDVTCPRIGTT